MTIKETITALHELGAEHGYDIQVEARMHGSHSELGPGGTINNSCVRIEHYSDPRLPHTIKTCILEFGCRRDMANEWFQNGQITVFR